MRGRKRANALVFCSRHFSTMDGTVLLASPKCRNASLPLGSASSRLSLESPAESDDLDGYCDERLPSSVFGITRADTCNCETAPGSASILPLGGVAQLVRAAES